MLAAKRAVITPVQVTTFKATDTGFGGGWAAEVSDFAADTGCGFCFSTCEAAALELCGFVSAGCRMTTAGGGSIAAINGYTRATRKTPAATIVAAWMRA